jgi:hypothetical protein
MPSGFGPSATQQFPLFDPRYERAVRGRFLRPDVPRLALANSFYCPGGKYASRGWILMNRANYNQINPYSTSLVLTIDDLNGGRIVIPKLTVVQAQCVSRGRQADPAAVYLVEITDARGAYRNAWAELGTTSAYNVRSPAYDAHFYDGSIQPPNPFTWTTLLSDLWGQMPLLGAFPSLPTVPSQGPENWWFPGTCALDALESVLDYLGWAVAVNPTQASPYTIKSGNDPDAVFTALQGQYAKLLEDDLEYIDTGSGRVPGQVVVYFHRRNQYYGTEETIRRDTLQWATTPLYSVTVAAPAPFNVAAGTGYIWADFTVRYDIDNNPVGADVTAATSVANDLVTRYFGRIYRGTLGYMNQTYCGALPFYTGSLCDGVRWFQDFRFKERQGWMTQIKRGDWPAFSAVADSPPAW